MNKNEDNKLENQYEYDQSTNIEMQKNNNNQSERKIRKNKFQDAIIMGLAFGFVASLTFQATSAFGNALNNNQQVINTTQPTISQNITSVTSDVSDIVEKTMPSVVSITNLSVEEVNYWIFGTHTYETTSSGSGIIIGKNDTELLIVTNNHVIENNTELTVSFIDEQSVSALVKGTDKDKDLAIIAVSLEDISDDTINNIKIATLGDSNTLQVGEPAIAIGNALGYGQSVTSGIISAIDRTIEGYDGGLLQTDAAINPGNSGGALLNAAGEVIGINTAKITDNTVEGMGYAIPISEVMDILNDLMSKETLERVPEEEQGSLGIQVQDVDQTVIDMFGIPSGVYVNAVTKDGAAETAGIEAGMIISEIDGTKVSNIDDLKDKMQYYGKGTEVSLTVYVKEGNGFTQTTFKVVLE